MEQIAEINGKLDKIAEKIQLEENLDALNEDGGQIPTAEQQGEERSHSRPTILHDLSRPLISRQFIKELETEIFGDEASGGRQKLMEFISEGDLRERLSAGQQGGDEDDANLAFQVANQMLRAIRGTVEERISDRMALEDKDKAELFQTISKLKSLLTVKRWGTNSVLI
jgi:hypothetical protein